MLSAPVDDDKLFALNAWHALLQRPVLLVDPPDAGKTLFPLCLTIDHVIVVLARGRNKGVDDVAVRKLRRPLCRSRRKLAALIDLGDFRLGVRTFGPILIGKRRGVIIIYRHPRAAGSDEIIQPARNGAP